MFVLAKTVIPRILDTVLKIDDLGGIKVPFHPLDPNQALPGMMHRALCGQGGGPRGGECLMMKKLH